MHMSPVATSADAVGPDAKGGTLASDDGLSLAGQAKAGYAKAGILALVLCNVGGMVDFVALPLWVGSLMQSRGLNAQQAGMLVTLYILGVLGGSLMVSPRLNSLNGRLTASIGFLVAALALLSIIATQSLTAMSILHGIAGLGVGWGLSATHGAIARSQNPHRVFGLGGLGTAIFAIVFFATVPHALAVHGINALFLVLAGLLGISTLAAAAAFPHAGAVETKGPDVNAATISPSVRALAFMGVACLTTTQAMVFGFIERAGVAHGFGADKIGLMLLVSGFVNLSAPVVAAVLQRRLSSRLVSIGVLPLHGLCGALAMLAPTYLPYAIFATLMVWLVVFGHNFIFSLIAALDPSGRTAASTPAMLMVGSAIGPVAGGTLVDLFGYGSLAVASGVLALMGCCCFLIVSGLKPAVVLVPARKGVPG
jgi:predicted MFS family arabinose efflux permease